MRGYFTDIIAPIFVGIAIGSYCAFIITTTVSGNMDKNTYRKCRYYDQPIERCVTELGWEKK